MRIVVSDTSCLVDLGKAALLLDMLRLPYTFVVPDILFENEWKSTSQAEKSQLCKLGLEVRELPASSVLRAYRYFNRHKPLKVYDCFAWALAEDLGDSILLTGDGQLRKIVSSNGIEVHGVLWIIDELERHDVLRPKRLHHALQQLSGDKAVFLPREELTRRLRHFAKLIGES